MTRKASDLLLGNRSQPARGMDAQPGSIPAKLDWEMIWSGNEAGLADEDDRPSRNATTYSSIKRMILTGQVGPGYKLVHEELAEILKVSRTPVRESLERLYQEGFVTRLPRRGFYVMGITRDEAYDLYAAREALEFFALQLTMRNGPVSAAAIERLEAWATKYEELSAAQVLTDRILADVLLHLELAKLSGNHYIVRLLAQTLERLAVKRRHQGYQPVRSQSAAIEHRQFMAALIAFDKREAAQVLRRHIVSARDALISQLHEEPPVLPTRASRALASAS